jgi:uncharacterized membrane-anchored protein
MIRSLSRLQLGVLAAATIQLGILGSMVVDRMWLLKNGREVVMPIIPVDPRDLFRGDYVTLSFPVSRIKSDVVDTAKPIMSSKFYVTLDQGADGAWTPSRLGAAMPAKTAPNQIVLKAKETNGWGTFLFPTQGSVRTLNVHYGFERYYVQEGTGTRLEKLARDKKLELILAVDGKGNAAIKGLNVDGKRIYDEPVL